MKKYSYALYIRNLSNPTQADLYAHLVPPSGTPTFMSVDELRQRFVSDLNGVAQAAAQQKRSAADIFAVLWSLDQGATNWVETGPVQATDSARIATLA